MTRTSRTLPGHVRNCPGTYPDGHGHTPIGVSGVRSDVRSRLLSAGEGYPAAVLLAEFEDDLDDLAHLTLDQWRDAVQLAALWHGWRRCSE